MNTSILQRIDHLVYSTPDLEKSVLELGALLGVRPAQGGQHPGRGTRNALLRLSERSYLEIVGPDESQQQVVKPRWFQLDTLDVPRLVGWAVKASELDRLSARAKVGGISLGPVVSGSRERLDGSYLRWQFTDPSTVVADGIVPFFIDWGDSPHPAASAPPGPVLESLRAEHPNPAEVMRALGVIGLDLLVEFGPRPALIATFRTEAGIVQLR